MSYLCFKCCFSPVVIEVPHFASLRGREREVVVLRSDNGETWKEHTVDNSEDAIYQALGGSFEGEGDFLFGARDGTRRSIDRACVLLSACCRECCLRLYCTVCMLVAEWLNAV